MSWPKGKTRKQVEASNEPEETAISGVEAESSEGIATQDTWRYHEEHEPRVFLKGDPIPFGWTLDHSVSSKWHRKSTGEWVKVS